MQLEAYEKVNDLNRTHIVYLKHKKTGLDVVKKTVHVQQGINEINRLKKLNCACFPRLIDFEINATHVVIYTLKVQGVRWDLIAQDHKMHQHIVENIGQVTRNAVLLLELLKNEGIVHGDVKPDNLFIDGALNVKLIDFGSAVCEDSNERQMGALRYMAPENVLASEHPSYLSDCFAMGKAIIELIGDKKITCDSDILDRIVGLSAIRPKIRKNNYESFKVYTCK